MVLKPKDKFWLGLDEYTTLRQLALEKGDKIEFKFLNSGIFIFRGQQSQLQRVEQQLDSLIDKGFEVSKLNITAALEEADKTVDSVDETPGIQVLSDDGNVADKLCKNADEEMNESLNYFSSPECSPVKKKRKEVYVSGSRTCQTCLQHLDKNERVRMMNILSSF